MITVMDWPVFGARTISCMPGPCPAGTRTGNVPAGMTVVGLNKLLDPHFDAKRDSVVEKRPATWQYEVDTYDGYSI